MIELYQKVRDIGVSVSDNSNEIKKIKLLNVFCLFWLSFLVVFSLGDFLALENPWPNITAHICSAICIAIIFSLQRKRIFVAARILYIILSLETYILFANLLEIDSLMEYFLIIVPLISLLFIDSLKFNIGVLLVSFASFYLPIIFLDRYEGVDINPLTNLMLFVSAFVIVQYFKSLNFKNEQLLELQRNKAIETGIELAEKTKHLESLNKFQLHFMVNISHEIKTPLTIIKGMAAKIERESTIQNIPSHVASLNKNAEKINVLVNDIIDLTKMNAKELNLVFVSADIVELMQNIVASFDSLFKEKNITVNFNQLIQNVEINCKVDKTYFERAISNLLINAHKYTPVNGIINVDISSSNNNVLIEITDTGCGIPDSDYKNIFKPFYRSENVINQAGGSGIGLSFSKEVIDKHGGTIEVKSELNKGSTFSVKIEGEISSKSTVPIKDNLPVEKQQNIKVLLVEDNADMRGYITDILSGFTVSQATDGQNALSLLTSVVPDIIITDYMMPNMDGYEFIKEVKNRGFDCPVIVLTARMDMDGKLNFLRLGIDDYITKPFHEDELLLRINHSVLNNRSKQQSLPEDIVVDEQSPFTEKVKAIILENIENNDFKIVDLAEALAMTERTLHRKVKSVTGLSPNGFIREVKLQKIRTICAANNDYTLKELALKIGLKNGTHLAKLYYERFGKELLNNSN